MSYAMCTNNHCESYKLGSEPAPRRPCEGGEDLQGGPRLPGGRGQQGSRGDRLSCRLEQSGQKLKTEIVVQ